MGWAYNLAFVVVGVLAIFGKQPLEAFDMSLEISST